ncbi:hypothetical protein JCM3770_000611 [Rhodotorula araucariae]
MVVSTAAATAEAAVTPLLSPREGTAVSATEAVASIRARLGEANTPVTALLPQLLTPADTLVTAAAKASADTDVLYRSLYILDVALRPKINSKELEMWDDTIRSLEDADVDIDQAAPAAAPSAKGKEREASVEPPGWRVEVAQQQRKYEKELAQETELVRLHTPRSSLIEVPWGPVRWSATLKFAQIITSLIRYRAHLSSKNGAVEPRPSGTRVEERLAAVIADASQGSGGYGRNQLEKALRIRRKKDKEVASGARNAATSTSAAASTSTTSTSAHAVGPVPGVTGQSGAGAQTPCGSAPPSSSLTPRKRSAALAFKGLVVPAKRKRRTGGSTVTEYEKENVASVSHSVDVRAEDSLWDGDFLADGDTDMNDNTPADVKPAAAGHGKGRALSPDAAYGSGHPPVVALAFDTLQHRLEPAARDKVRLGFGLAPRTEERERVRELSPNDLVDAFLALQDSACRGMDELREFVANALADKQRLLAERDLLLQRLYRRGGGLPTVGYCGRYAGEDSIDDYEEEGWEGLGDPCAYPAHPFSAAALGGARARGLDFVADHSSGAEENENDQANPSGCLPPWAGESVAKSHPVSTPSAASQSSGPSTQDFDRDVEGDEGGPVGKETESAAGRDGH